MAVGIGAILPTPIVAVSLIYELFALSFPTTTTPTNDSSYVYLKYIVCAGIGSIFSYAITVGIGTVSSANHLGDEWSMQLETVDGIFSDWAPLKGALLGVIGGTLGMLFVALTAVCNKGASKLSTGLDRLKSPIPKLRKILTPALGGLLVGVIAWIVPGSTGTGEAGMIFLSQSEFGGNYDAVLLVATGFGKLVALSICLGFGWTGGMIYPLLFIGSAIGAGISAATGWNRLLCMASLSASLMASHMPAPFTFWAVSTTVFRAGEKASGKQSDML